MNKDLCSGNYFKISRYIPFIKEFKNLIQKGTFKLFSPSGEFQELYRKCKFNQNILDKFKKGKIILNSGF